LWRIEVGERYRRGAAVEVGRIRARIGAIFGKKNPNSKVQVALSKRPTFHIAITGCLCFALEKPDHPMKTRLFLLTALWLFPAVCNTSMGGDHSGKSLVLNDAVPALVDPTIDIRLRYEYGDQEVLDPSHAATMRNRIGLLTRDLGGF